MDIGHCDSQTIDGVINCNCLKYNSEEVHYSSRVLVSLNMQEQRFPLLLQLKLCCNVLKYDNKCINVDRHNNLIY
jgi:hypothetical protein